MRSSDLDRLAAAWFARHQGVISRQEALRLGATTEWIRRRTESGEWQVVHRGVYLASSWPGGPEQRMRAAVVATGPDAVVSHMSAAWLWRIIDRPPEEVQVTVAGDRHPRLPGVHVFRVSHPVGKAERFALPCTDPLATLLGAATLLPPPELDDLLDRAIGRRLLRLHQLPHLLQPRPDEPTAGRPALRRALADRGLVGGPAPSVLESRTARLMTRHGLPVPKAEVVWGPDGRYRLDYAYPQRRFAFEVGGSLAHAFPRQRRHDALRRNELNRAGWTVLDYDWWQITHDGDRVAKEIASTYHALEP